MQKTTFLVEGMSCSHCENRVRKALSALRGVSNVEVSLENKTVTVDFDGSAVTEDQMKMAVEEQGYDVAETRA
jgi:copper chaperone